MQIVSNCSINMCSSTWREGCTQHWKMLLDKQNYYSGLCAIQIIIILPFNFKIIHYLEINVSCIFPIRDVFVSTLHCLHPAWSEDEVTVRDGERWRAKETSAAGADRSVEWRMCQARCTRSSYILCRHYYGRLRKILCVSVLLLHFITTMCFVVPGLDGVV